MRSGGNGELANVKRHWVPADGIMREEVCQPMSAIVRCEIRTCRRIMSFVMDSIGAVSGACIGVGLVDEDGRATRSSVSE